MISDLWHVIMLCAAKLKKYCTSIIPVLVSYLAV